MHADIERLRMRDYRALNDVAVAFIILLYQSAPKKPVLINRWLVALCLARVYPVDLKCSFRDHQKDLPGVAPALQPLYWAYRKSIHLDRGLLVVFYWVYP